MQVFHHYMQSRLANKEEEFQRGSRNSRLAQKVLDNLHLVVKGVDLKVQTRNASHRRFARCFE